MSANDYVFPAYEIPDSALRAPRITKIAQVDGTIRDLDWDAALDLLEGDPVRPYSDPEQRAAMIRALSDAYTRFRIGHDMYEAMAAEMKP